jgi:DNA-binding LacI/PurR family transcriptional regulator
MTTNEKTARLADVAKAAGVSQGTVSNVFNRPGVVREEVREHVRAVAEKLGYRGPDPRGRMLRAGKVNAIGVTTTEPLSYFFTDPYVRVLMTGITEQSDRSGVGISLVSAASEEDLAWNIRNALVDGLILFCLDDAQRLIALARERQLPFVALSLGMFDATVPAVGIDNVAGARHAAEHLIGLGHRRFAILSLNLVPEGTGPVSYARAAASLSATPRDRFLGYTQAFEAAGIDPASVPIHEGLKGKAAIDAALEKLFAAPEPPTAILAQADRIALVAIDWLTEHGYDVPGDVSIVGFDGIPESAVSEPPLTTIEQPIRDIGRKAAEIVLEHGDRVRHEVLETKLVVRQSTAPPPHRG